MKYNLALIFPCFNESQRVTATLEAYLAYFKKEALFKDQSILLLFVDDGSTDNTFEVLQKFELRTTANVTIKAIGYQENRGKGGAIKFGLSNILADVYGFVDADNSFKAESVPKMLEALKNSDFVLARSVCQNKKSFYDRFRSVFSLILKKIANYLIDIPNIDTQRGFKFFNQRVVDLVISRTVENRFAFDLELVARARNNNLRLSFVDVAFEHDSRSAITWQDGARYLFDVVAIADRVRLKADRFFWGQLAMLSVLITTVFFGWTVSTGYFFSDDFTWLWHGTKIGWHLNAILNSAMSTFFSPMLNLYYVAMFQWFGYNAAGYFLFGLLLHVSNALLAGILVWQLERSRLITVLTVAIVALAGGAYEPLVWLAANMHPWVTQWILLSIVTYVAYHKSGRIIWLPISLVSAIGAFLTKEVAIVLPALLFFLCLMYWPIFKNRFKNIFNLSWLFLFIASCCWYAYSQYLWQKNSVWVVSKVWSITLQGFLKAPMAALDLFIPLSLFNLKQYSAIFVFLLALGLFIYLLKKYWSIRLIRFGIFWIFISMAPTVFFLTPHWWMPLASRYTYLPRLGMVMIISALIHYYITKNKSRRIVNGLVVVLLFVMIVQISMMMRLVDKEYLYVYNTGRTLVVAMEKIKDCQPAKILVRWYYPFFGNNAHIVAAASTIAGYQENQLVFLEKNDAGKVKSGEALLYWQANKKRYEVDCRKN